MNDHITFDPFDLDQFAKDIDEIEILNSAKPQDGCVPPGEDPETYEYPEHVIYSYYNCEYDECDFGFSDDVIAELEWVRKVLIKSRDILNAYKRMCDVYGFPKKEDHDKFLDEVSKIKLRVQDEIYDAYYEKIEYRSPIDDIPQSPEQIIDEIHRIILPYVRQNHPEYIAMEKVFVSPIMEGGHSTSVVLSTDGANFGTKHKEFEARFDAFGVLEFIRENED